MISTMDAKTKNQLVETIRDSIIGNDRVIETPFGHRRVTYADYTASGRCLGFIEDYIRDQVMPLYANTHTLTSGTGRQTTKFREDARSIIHDAVGGSDDDVVIFAGSGATAAIHKLIACLNIRIPANLDEQYNLSSHIPENERPVVFIGPYEHHSNELPWRESLADVVTIDEDSDGLIDQALLEENLKKYADRPLKIGSFSAASNVTGIGSKTVAISKLLHRYGALSFWDFAAAGPYVQIEMNPEGEGAHKDAVFLSPHKFVGGPGTPGILVVKKNILRNRVPSVPGGGTVSFVSSDMHQYTTNPTAREEGGTPAILGAVRAGLTFQLKEAVGTDEIRSREHAFVTKAIDAWREHPQINILGNKDAWRLSIVSFNIRCPQSGGMKYLHHNFIVALLNDLFGIQARGGCSCAGPYGHRLLDIDITSSNAYKDEVVNGCEGIRPGWVRLNFNYFISELTAKFIIDAVDLIATNGWKLLPWYDFCPESGIWRHRQGNFEAPMSLKHVSYREGRMQHRSRVATEPAWAVDEYLEEARKIIADAETRFKLEQPEPLKVTAAFETLRWFPMPHEVAAQIQAS